MPIGYWLWPSLPAIPPILPIIPIPFFKSQIPKSEIAFVYCRSAIGYWPSLPSFPFFPSFPSPPKSEIPSPHPSLKSEILKFEIPPLSAIRHQLFRSPSRPVTPSIPSVSIRVHPWFTLDEPPLLLLRPPGRQQLPNPQIMHQRIPANPAALPRTHQRRQIPRRQPSKSNSRFSQQAASFGILRRGSSQVTLAIGNGARPGH